jgi:hypothetical protein
MKKLIYVGNLKELSSFTYVGNLTELSSYTFMTASGAVFNFDFQAEEDFSIQNDGSITLSIKTTLLPVEFYSLGKIDKLIIETPVRDLSTGKNIILVKELVNTTLKINYQLKCNGDRAIVNLFITGNIDQEYLKKVEEL